MNPASHRLGRNILAALAVGLMAGIAAAWHGESHPAWLAQIQSFATAVLDPLGRIFLHLLFWAVVPLVFATLAQGVLQLGNVGGLGRLSWRVALLFAANMVIGVALGLVAMNWLAPGASLTAEARQQLLRDFTGAASATLETVAAEPMTSFRALVDIFLPRNLLKAVVEFQLLPLMLFALLVGAAGARLPEASRLRLHQALELITELMLRLVGWAMYLAPLAVPAMIFSTVVKAGLPVVNALLGFVLVCLGVMALHLFGTLSLWLKWLAGRSPWAFFKAIRTVLVTAFSTSSSSATLPASLAACRESLGVSAPVAGFVLPLGATLNMSGTALYEGCVVLFVAQVYGVPLSWGMQALLLVMTVLSAVAVAGIPGGSLPLIAGLLHTFGVPPEGLALVLGADRLLDMARTTVNVTADLVTATVVDRHWREFHPPGPL
ncbi:dicarboxylate/amino acid:cation symporter [Fontisphaera persica]|uniref:dicarboxylate/amino acid:cation symporter n=1 Tax=Fontisphaera persica TaxID=2974023 RepID=UPI0024C04789|nr:dicarboxylate/amino acid:cation symporter [Fontisphaera persica]WCJ61011.1 dicarboxylate/amino acid:cation symporter [Fontisphaera persica]